jgi:hypothetical protein
MLQRLEIRGDQSALLSDRLIKSSRSRIIMLGVDEASIRLIRENFFRLPSCARSVANTAARPQAVALAAIRYLTPPRTIGFH